ncbi:MAG: TetR/AcrR family transcriptional regulator [Methanoregulaceae archaeon]
MPKIFPQYKEDAKKKIVQAAMAVAIRNGYQTMTVEDVAKEVGVTKGALYVYFQNKEELFNEVLIGISKMIREAMEYSHTEGDLDTVLNRLVDQLFRVVSPNVPVFAELVSISSRDPAVRRMIEEMLGRNVGIIENEIRILQEQNLLPEDLDLHAAALEVTSISIGMGARIYLGADREDTKKLWITSVKKILRVTCG